MSCIVYMIMIAYIKNYIISFKNIKIIFIMIIIWYFYDFHTSIFKKQLIYCLIYLFISNNFYEYFFYNILKNIKNISLCIYIKKIFYIIIIINNNILYFKFKTSISYRIIYIWYPLSKRNSNIIFIFIYFYYPKNKYIYIYRYDIIVYGIRTVPKEIIDRFLISTSFIH